MNDSAEKHKLKVKKYLELENVSVLAGAGTSFHLGAPVIRTIPAGLKAQCTEEIIKGSSLVIEGSPFRVFTHGQASAVSDAHCTAGHCRPSWSMAFGFFTPAGFISSLILFVLVCAVGWFLIR